MPDIARRIRLASAYEMVQTGAVLYEHAPFTLIVRMLKAEVMETLLYGCVTSTLSQRHTTNSSYGSLDFQRRQRTDHLFFARQGPQCESVQTTIHKTRLLCAGILLSFVLLRPCSIYMHLLAEYVCFLCSSPVRRCLYSVSFQYLFSVIQYGYTVFLLFIVSSTLAIRLLDISIVQ